MSGFNLSRNVVTIKNGLTQDLNVGGSSFWIEDSGQQPFSISFDNKNKLDCKEGISMPTDPFNRLTIQNKIAGVDITVIIWTGDKTVNYLPKTIAAVQKDAPTYTKGYDDVVTAAGGITAYAGLDGVNVRKFFACTNLAAVGSGNNLQLVDANGKKMMTIYPQETKGLQTSGYVGVKNPNGGNVSHEATETIYS